MNEVQKALSSWLQETYKVINLKVMQEADLLGFKKEAFDNKEVELIHKVTEGKIEGCFQINYGVKRGEHITRLLTVEFLLNKFVMYGHRKTKLIKSALNGKRLRKV